MNEPSQIEISLACLDISLPLLKRAWVISILFTVDRLKYRVGSCTLHSCFLVQKLFRVFRFFNYFRKSFKHLKNQRETNIENKLQNNFVDLFAIANEMQMRLKQTAVKWWERASGVGLFTLRLMKHFCSARGKWRNSQECSYSCLSYGSTFLNGSWSRT